MVGQKKSTSKTRDVNPNDERLSEKREKRVSKLRKQEARGVYTAEIEKTRKEIEWLESRMAVASQAMATISAEITRLSESELLPQLLMLLYGLKSMWTSMREYHYAQAHVAQQLEYLTTTTTTTTTNSSSSSSPGDSTSDHLRQSTLQLELAVQRWDSSFCILIKSQRDYIQSLAGWLRLSLSDIQAAPHAKTQADSELYALCEEWQLALDRLPDQVASEVIKSFITAIHAVVLQQEQERKQRKRLESALKAHEKKRAELRSSERRGVDYSLPRDDEGATRWSLLEAKREKVEALRARAEEERTKYEECAGATRAMALSILQTRLPSVFRAMAGFSSACMQAFKAVYNHHRKGLDRRRGLKVLLPEMHTSVP